MDAGEVLATIETDAGEIVEVEAPVDGMVLWQDNHPLVSAGRAIGGSIWEPASPILFSAISSRPRFFKPSASSPRWAVLFSNRKASPGRITW